MTVRVLSLRLICVVVVMVEPPASVMVRSLVDCAWAPVESSAKEAMISNDFIFCILVLIFDAWTLPR
jgi:hypothetical protein